MFTDSPFEIEASDLDALVRAGDVIKLPDGRLALPVLLVLRDDAGKTFGADAGANFPTAMHLAAGASVRRMVFEHLGAAVIEAHVAPAAEAEPEASVEASSAESSQPAETAGSAPAADASAEDASDATESAEAAEGAEDQTGVESADDAAASEPANEPAANETTAPAETEA